MRRLLLASALLLSPGLALAQNTPSTSNDIHALHNDIVFMGNQIVAALKSLPAAPAPVDPTTAINALGAKIDTLNATQQAILAQLKAAPVTTTTSPTPTPTPAPVTATLTDPCASGQKWTALTIDPSVNINAAMACAAPAFKLALKPGTYTQVFHVPEGLDGFDIGGDPASGGNADTVKLDGQGGCSVAQNNAGGCATKLAWGKGIVHVSSSTGTIHDLEVRNGGPTSGGAHDLQAGIYLDTCWNAAACAKKGTVTITHVMARNNENGFASNLNASNVDIVLTEDDFVGNGADGGSHSAYLAGANSLVMNNLHDYGSNQGNDQKSRIPTVTSNGGFYKSVQGRWIECADGCTLKINGGTFVGNNCCQNMFGNGTESTGKGPGNTVWTGPSEIWLFRNTDFSNAGSFTASNVTVHLCPGGQFFNDKGTPLTGLVTDTTCNPPADPPLISGAKS